MPKGRRQLDFHRLAQVVVIMRPEWSRRSASPRASMARIFGGPEKADRARAPLTPAQSVGPRRAWNDVSVRGNGIVRVFPTCIRRVAAVCSFLNHMAQIGPAGITIRFFMPGLYRGLLARLGSVQKKKLNSLGLADSR